MYSSAERNNRAIFLERLGTIYRDQNKTQQAVDTFRKMVALGDDAVARGYQQIIETYRDAKRLARRHGRRARSRSEASQRPGVADGSGRTGSRQR